MHATSDQERARLMAQWLATGGAGPQTAEETPAGDDGLKASATYPGYGPYCADDGLKAAFSNQFAMPGCRVDDGLSAAFTVASGGGICADDGLKAAFSNQFAMPGCRVDDGLAAREPSFSHMCLADDGQRPSMTWPFPMGRCADDGLAAANLSGYSSSSCGLGDDGLTAGPFSYPAYCGNSADDGLAAQGSSFRRGNCFIDDGLTA